MQLGILAVNGGSSSIRLALHESDISLRLLRSDLISCSRGRDADHPALADRLIGWLESRSTDTTIVAVGHRIVQGITHTTPARITPALLDELRRIAPFDADHLPLELALIDSIHHHYPQLPQFACFDTAFHRDLPQVARLLPIPRRYQAQGIRRYGFHGLSYAYLMEELTRVDASAAKSGRIILAHLGNGSSLAAVSCGRCMDTSMAFTPAAGTMMGTRSGDLDPGLGFYLAQSEGMTPAQFQQMVTHESGLLGVSGISSDMRELLAQQSTAQGAADAVELYCYQIRKWIGAFAATLGGLDTLVFAGGIGENSATVRQRICAQLGFLGIVIDHAANDANSAVISTEQGTVRVRVIPTDEQLMIARSVSVLLQAGTA